MSIEIDMLQAFTYAWNHHDVDFDAIMLFMRADCVIEATAGPEVCGTMPDVSP